MHEKKEVIKWSSLSFYFWKEEPWEKLKTGKFLSTAFQLSSPAPLTPSQTAHAFTFSEAPKVTELFLFYPLLSNQTFILLEIKLEIKNN